VILSYDALGRTKMNQEARARVRQDRRGRPALDQPAPAQRRKKKADKLSERERALLEHGVRAWVEETLELPEGPQVRPRHRLGRHRHRHAHRRRGRRLQEQLQARRPARTACRSSWAASGEGSNRAWQLDFRAAAVRKRTGGSGIVLLTATPAKNSPLEFYNLIQFIDPHAFTRRGIHDPEQFIDRFLRIESRDVLDMTPSTSPRSPPSSASRTSTTCARAHLRYGEFRTAAEVGRSCRSRIRSRRSSPSPWTTRRRTSTAPTSPRSRTCWSTPIRTAAPAIASSACSPGSR
jgi:hypothetical protein